MSRTKQAVSLRSITLKHMIVCAFVTGISNLCAPIVAGANETCRTEDRSRVALMHASLLLGPHSVPSDTSQSASTRDLDWAVIEALMKSVKVPRGAEKSLLSGPSGDRYWIWQEASKRLLYDLGLAFYDRYPNDARRWTWLTKVLTETSEPFYFGNYGNLRAWVMGSPHVPVDTLVRETWKQRRPILIAELLTSSQATDEQKSAVAFADFYSRVRWVTFRDPKSTSEESRRSVWTLGEEFLALATKYPKEDNVFVVNGAGALLGFARKSDAAGDSLIARLLVNPNTAVRTFVNADIVFEKAAHTPMAMRFTALDGRKVDLANLRGKVVLIDFTAYTWCGACREAEPHVKAAYDQFHDKGLEIIGFAIEMDPADRVAVERYLSSHNIRWPHYFDGKGTDNEYMKQFGFNGVPEMLLLDKNGLLIGRSGGNRGMTTMLPLIKKALGVGVDKSKDSAQADPTGSREAASAK